MSGRIGWPTLLSATGDKMRHACAIAVVALVPIVLMGCTTTNMQPLASGAPERSTQERRQESTKQAEVQERKRQAAHDTVGTQHEFEAFEAILSAMEQCAKRVLEDARFRPLLEKSPLPAEMQFKHYIDKSYISNNEKKILLESISESEKCYTKNPYPDNNKFIGQFFLIFDNAWKSEILLAVQLYNRDITWGQYNSAQRSHFDKFTAEVQQLVQQLKDRIEQKLKVSD